MNTMLDKMQEKLSPIAMKSWESEVFSCFT